MSGVAFPSLMLFAIWPILVKSLSEVLCFFSMYSAIPANVNDIERHTPINGNKAFKTGISVAFVSQES